jgi:hemerythrin
MPPSQWRDSYRTCIPEIDEQHIGLFEAAASLADAMERGEGERGVRMVLLTLLEYTRSHFAFEEALLRSVGYPELDKHLLEHAQFVATLRKWIDEPEFVAPKEVLAFIEQWLVAHIARSDAAYVPYVMRDSQTKIPGG